MRYLYGDSTESDLETNYLAFLRQVIDCAVLLMKHKVGRATATERRRLKDQEIVLAIKALEDLGVQVAENYRSIVNNSTPIGRVMSAMVEASFEAIERESQALRASSRAELDRAVQEDRGDRMRCIAALESLLCAHDLPGAELSREVLWRDTPRAQLHARARYAEATLTLEIPSTSILAGELRVDRVVEGLEVHALEEGGWIKKNHKLVPNKVGRHIITRVFVSDKLTTIRLRAEGGGALEIDVAKSGEITVERHGENGLREPTIDGKQRAGFQQLADRLEAAVVALDKRLQLASFEIDGVSILEHQQPHLLAERLIEVIAPVVQTIAKHSRNPDELVLRRPLGDDRREEIFVTVKELAGKLDVLPPDARQVFAPLGFVKRIDSERIDSERVEAKPVEAKPVEAKPVEAKPVETIEVASVEAPLADVTPADAKSGDAKAVDAKSVDAKPDDAKPSDAKPDDAKPSDAKAVDAKATEVVAVEAASQSAEISDAAAAADTDAVASSDVEAALAKAKAMRAKAAEARLLGGIDSRLADALDARLADARDAAEPSNGAKPAFVPAIKVPAIAVPRRIPPPPISSAAMPRTHGPTVELDDAADLIDVTPEPVAADGDSTKRHAGLLPRASRPSEDVAAAVEAALDAISDAASKIADKTGAATEPAPAPAAEAAPTAIAELLKSERKPLPRALIIETGEYQPLAKPEASGS